MRFVAVAGFVCASFARSGRLALAIGALAGLSVGPVLADPALAGPALAGPALAGSSPTALTSTPNPSTVGQTVTFTARVSGGAPTGTVTLKDGSKVLGSGALRFLPDTRALSAGRNTVCALTSAGGVECWGNNTSGQLGDGNAPNGTDVPGTVIGLDSGVTAVEMAFYTACAVTDAGTVKCWGDNSIGQLGDGNAPNGSDRPVDVLGLPAGIVSVAVGYLHACALTDGGAVWCWGDNSDGQLGDGNMGVDSAIPVPVQGLSSGVVAIAAGYGDDTCAVTETGAAKCWGSNGYGNLGDGTQTNRDTPVDVIGLPGPVAAISPHHTHTCAVTEAGAAWCWGYGWDGQLGNGANAVSNVPVAVSGLGSGVATIDTGGNHSCAVTDAGTAWCWGRNSSGQLGNGGEPVATNIPVPVTGLSDRIVAVSAGSIHTCALTSSGAAKCWGNAAWGQLGDGNAPTGSDTPVDVVGFGAGTALVRAEATISTTKLRGGKRRVTARYGSDGVYDASAFPPLTQIVRKGKTRTKIAVSPGKPNARSLVRLNVGVKGLSPAKSRPAGKLTVRDGRRKIGTFKVRRGRANVRLGALAPGRHALEVLFRGNRDWKRSHATTSVTIPKPPMGR
ncbi:Ig-like domain repeat protein [Microbaculum marinisediminis]|uniref:Chromosome condensation regulator RCC1 n=1 Tax=Microbaculum marinisediminis TaxID=2931392 RepID=A0AAW5QXL3_9HYPH|nr:chromosome condensation regulator RCC1 [Microbaculum sp. A6E488]MCT8972662.1 chromosome condensation regulator RCC1 [Microbaculum sp. A6E488]